MGRAPAASAQGATVVYASYAGRGHLDEVLPNDAPRRPGNRTAKERAG